MAEILRMEVLEDKANALQVTVVHAFDDPRTWGIALCDAARHIAAMYSKLDGLNEAEVLADIARLFNDEMDKPTSPCRGVLTQ